MDLTSDEIKKIKFFIQEWTNRPEQNIELESTFGEGGRVDSSTFLHIAQRLRSKGYSALPQDDRISILTQIGDRAGANQDTQIRFSLEGLGVLQEYCRDDTIEGKPFTAMVKRPITPDRKESNLELREYNVRVKARSEILYDEKDPRILEMLSRWDSLKKAYRLIRRWTFKGPGIRVDLSMVRSTPIDNRGDFRWSTRFQDYNIFKETPHYEVEVELEHDTKVNTAPDITLKNFIRGIGDVLRGIQKNSLLIRKSIRQKVIDTYKEMMKSDRFRGVNPVVLEKKNMIVLVEDGIPNIRSGYNVTDKADGLRCLGFVDKKGDFYMIDMALNVYRTGLRNNTLAESLVDGEWISRDADDKYVHMFMIFDMYKAPGNEDISDLPFANPENEEEDGRYIRLQKWIKSWDTNTEIIDKSVTALNSLKVFIKRFILAKDTDPTSIFSACRDILRITQPYHTDGLILTPNKLGLPSRPGRKFAEQFKWKPAKDNTIDFLINIEKDITMPNMDKLTRGEHPITHSTVEFKTLRLYIGSERDPVTDDPRRAILDELQLPDAKSDKKNHKYKPILFTPKQFPDTMSNTCYIETIIDPESGQSVIMTENGEPINDRMIVEMRYDPSQKPGWRWIPLRIRYDKTERLQRAEAAAKVAAKEAYEISKRTGKRVPAPGIDFSRTMNSEENANTTWNSIHDPVTISMITTGSEQPTADEIKELVIKKEADIELEKIYYEQKAPAEDLAIVRGMREFHNRWVKEQIMYLTVLQNGDPKNPGGKSIIDFACGKTADAQIWRRRHARFVFGVDLAGDNINNPKNGAYARYMENIISFGSDKVPRCVFAIGNSSKNIVSGAAGATPEESDIMRSVMGRFPSEGPLPKYVEKSVAGSLRSGADVGVCMFAIHYFFENKDILEGFLTNVSECIKVGGYFIGACFDGRKVFDMLRDVNMGEAKEGKNGTNLIWSIRKQYDTEELTDDDSSLGKAIDVSFITIGTEHREYLVSFEYLKRKMKAIGFDLLTPGELKDLGLEHSTNTFDVSYKMAEKAKHKYEMENAVKEFSFLNRWFIFKRHDMKAPEDIEVAVADDILKAAEQVAKLQEEPDKEEAKEEKKDDKEIKEDDTAITITEEEKGPETFRLPSPDALFYLADIFRVGPKVSLDEDDSFDIGAKIKFKDRTKLGNGGVGRWLALNALFPIRDPEEEDVVYPSIEHFMAGMIMKKATKKPSLAKTLFSSTGSIHARFQGIRSQKVGKRGILSDKDYYEILEDETSAVAQALKKSELRAFGVKVDDTVWNSIKNDMLRIGLTERWERDAVLKDIVENARTMGKYILYYTGSAASDIGGTIVKEGVQYKIAGENKVGKLIMELAGFMF